MSASIIHPYEWSSADIQYFLTVNPNSDQVNIIESAFSAGEYTQKNVTVPSLHPFKYIQCFDYSPVEQGLIAVGNSSGDVVVSNILKKKTDSEPSPFFIESTPSDRSCNDLSFNTTGLLVAGYDKVRSSPSLKVYDVKLPKYQEIYSTLPGEPARSVSFISNEPNSLICGSYKFLRGYDIRANISVFSLGTTYVEGVTIDPLNNNYFATHTDKGILRVWDRRRMSSASSGSEYLLSINPFNETGHDKEFPAFRMSCTRSGEFSFLSNDGSVIKRWQTGQVPEITRSQVVPHSPTHTNSTSTASSMNTLNHTADVKLASYLFVSSVLQSKGPEKYIDKSPMVSFDYVPDLVHSQQINFVCLQENGDLFRLKAVESSSAVHFDPINTVAVADHGRVFFQQPYDMFPPSTPSQMSVVLDASVDARGRRVSATSTESILEDGDSSEEDSGTDDDESYQDDDRKPLTVSALDPDALLHTVGYTLESDISVTIRRLAMNGYSMDCEKNIDILHPLLPEFARRDKLVAAWQWIGCSKKGHSQLVSGPVDLSYEGVMGIWKGYEWIIQKMKSSNLSRQDFDVAISRILSTMEMGKKKKVFTMVAQPNQSKRNLRQLCLRVAGWNFDETQLEPMLQQFESEKQYEKAAGWAVFHGNVNRAVQSLAKSKSPKHRMMSAAIAGYDGYKRTTLNTPWKDLCRNMATSLDNPYMRAVFGFIADGDWSEVLEEGSLPLNERLGIALRFYKDHELSIYLNKLTRNVIKNGDIDGVILTGITPMAADLFQSYVDKTADVQTASLAISFACPLYFRDDRATHWVECYRGLLNSWKLYAKRSMFDIARARASKSADGRITAKVVPRQVYLSCHNCKGIIGNELANAGNNTTILGPLGQVLMGPMIGPPNAVKVPSNESGGNSPGTRQDSVSPSNAAAIGAGGSGIFMKAGPGAVLPAQQYLSSQLKAHNDASNTNIRCPHCNYPLPRCAVCLLPLGSMPSRMGNDNSLPAIKNLKLGTSSPTPVAPPETQPLASDINDTTGNSLGVNGSGDPSTKNGTSQPNRDAQVVENKFDRFFVFCLSCSHGMHAGHAKEWFAKHTLCAIPDCDCPCTKYQ